VLHVHVPNTSAFWALAPGMPGNAPLVVHWHADVVPSAIDRRLALLYNGYRVLERRLLDRSARIVATSHPYLEHSAPLRPHRDKCRIVPLGLDPERLAAVTPDTPPPGAASVLERAGSRPLVMALGRLTYYKGFDVLLRAAAEVPDACFAVVGQGPLLGRLQEQARALGVEDRVVLAGGLPDADVHCLLSRCAAFCLPSVERTEAFGVVLLEAMFHGRPLVSTAIPGSGVGVVNKEGESGLHVPVGDPAALAAALRTLLGDEALRRRLGRGARQRLAQRFGMEPVARGVQAVYDEAVSPKSW
jgi:rhamnosyl/mannosyltransferase